MFAEVLWLYWTLRKCKQNPKLPRKEVSALSGHKSGPKCEEPFTKAEVARMMARFKEIAPSSYYGLFPN
jgi:hypothetical protein